MSSEWYRICKDAEVTLIDEVSTAGTMENAYARCAGIGSTSRERANEWFAVTDEAQLRIFLFTC
jgi:hypothetical protein